MALFVSYIQVTVHSERKSEQELKTETWRKWLKEENVANAAFWRAQNDFLYNPDHWPKGGTTHHGLYPPTSIVNQENNP